MRRFNFKKIVWCYIAIVLVNISIGSLVVHAKPSHMLSALIQEAMRCNPQIKAARDRWLAANHAIPQARALPDPMLNAGYINMSGNIPGDVDPRKEQMLGGSQEIPFPGKLVVRGRIATLEAKRAAADYQATSLAVIAQLKRIYYDLYFANKSIDILQKNQLLLEDMEQSARTNYSVGKTPQQDVFRAQTEISRLLMRLVILRQERASLEADINRLLNRSLDSAINTPSTLSVTSLRYDIKHFRHS